MLNKNFYRAFEDRHRGSRELIKNRADVYLPFIMPLKEVYPNGKILDIGCGRGEWLELLQDNGFSAEGIDFDEGMLKDCSAMGLDVREGEGIAYLKTLKDDSYMVVSLFHVVEHISFEELQILVQEALRVLKPAGLLIMETPNPENIKVATENFYLDPTHVRPIPSALLSFLPESQGFTRTKVLRLQEKVELVDKKNINILDVMGGVSPDYAVIAQKEADKEILKKFDEVFSKEFGISLSLLTEKFENRLLDIETKVNELEQKLNEALASAQQAWHNFYTIESSNSWKMTKTLRLVKPFVKSTFLKTDKGISKVINFFILKKISQPITRPKNVRKKLFIDCSFIYSTSLNTGIQRVVRNIVYNIGKYAEQNDLELVTVALVNGFIVKVDMNKLQTDDNTPKSKISNTFHKIKKKVEIHKQLYMEVEVIYKDDILLMLDSTWHLDIWPSVKYAKQRGAKIIGVIYDLIPISHPQFCDDNLVRLFSSWYDESIKYFDGYIAISHTVMLDVQNYLKGKGVDIKKYSFDYFILGSDFKKKRNVTQKVRDELKTLYDKNRSIYLIVSTIEPRKNHQYLFDTFKRLWENNIDVTLVIVGRVGWKTEKLIDEMKQHPEYNNRLRIFNDLDDAELEFCYKNSKALLFPSYVEGYGLPIIESLQNNLPVLASDTPVHREVGKDMIEYFSIDDVSSLVDKIVDIENHKIKLKEVNQENMKILSWNESARTLLDSILKI